MAGQYLQNLPSRGYFMSCVPEFNSDGAAQFLQDLPSPGYSMSGIPAFESDGAAHFLQDLPSSGTFSSTYIPLADPDAAVPRTGRDYLCVRETALPEEQHTKNDSEGILLRQWMKGKNPQEREQEMNANQRMIRREQMMNANQRMIRPKRATKPRGITIFMRTPKRSTQEGNIATEKKRIERGTNKCLAEYISRPVTIMTMPGMLGRRTEGANKRPAEEASFGNVLSKRINVGHDRGRGDGSSRVEAEMLRSRYLADKELQSWAIEKLKTLQQKLRPSFTGTPGELLARAKKITRASVIARLKSSM